MRGDKIQPGRGPYKEFFSAASGLSANRGSTAASGTTNRPDGSRIACAQNDTERGVGGPLGKSGVSYRADYSHNQTYAYQERNSQRYDAVSLSLAWRATDHLIQEMRKGNL